MSPRYKQVDLAALADRLGAQMGNCMLVQLNRRESSAGQLQAEFAQRSAELTRNEYTSIGKQVPWMLTSRADDLNNGELSEIQGCYAALHAGIYVLKELRCVSDNLLNRPDFLIQLAQAQSALRVALHRLPVIDEDQELVFELLESYAKEKQMRIPRFMTLDDRGDPRESYELMERMYTHLDKSYRKAQWSFARELANRIRTGDPTAPVAELWVRLAVHIKNLVVDCKVKPDDSEIAKLLRPLRGFEPKESRFRPGLREWRFPEIEGAFEAAWREPNEGTKQDDAVRDPRPRTQEIVAVRQALAGRVLLLIGGDARPLAAERLTEAFGLADLRWRETKKHGTPIRYLIPAVTRADVALVVLLSFCDHAHGDLRNICAEHGKPFVQMPESAGFGLDRIAREIILQAGRMLGIDPEGEA